MYQRWEQVPSRSKYPLSTGHTCREAQFPNHVNVTKCSQDQCVKNGLMFGMKQSRQHAAHRKFVLADQIIVTTEKNCGQLPVNETVETPVTSTSLSVDCFELKTFHMSNKLLHTESGARYKHSTQVKMKSIIHNENYRRKI
jgi:hypothetical protein